MKREHTKQCLMAVLTAVLMCFVAYGQSQEKKSKEISKQEQQVMALNRSWADAITKGDAAALDRLFADDIIVTSGSGEIRNKAGEIKDAAGAPDPDFVWTRPFTTEDVRVRVYKDAGVVTGLAKWGFRYKGQEVTQERRYTHLYVKKQGQWRIVAQQVSTNLYKIDTMTSKCYVHHFRIEALSELDEEVRGWLREAYQVGTQEHLSR